MQFSTSIHGEAGRVRDKDACVIGSDFGDGARYFEGRCPALIGA